MDEDIQLQIVDVNEPERESNEFEDSVCKVSTVEIYQVYMLVQKYSESTPTHLIRFLNTLRTESPFMQGWLNMHSSN